MLSSLRGARREGGGVAGDAEELEEGEACSDGGGEGFFDPDVALSYIDEKLQYVLGHFQKDFEGGVSAENLGSKFGGYGSFLPTYQRSPLLPQSRSPHIAASISTSRSPYQPSAEKMDQNRSMVAVKSISLNNGPGAPSTSDLLKKERCSSTKDEESVAGSDSLDSSVNGSDSKSLKVWTKVCSNNDLPRKNSAIYSGLGLDISSSSSMEESPDSLGGLSPEFSNMPYESPRTILRVMTCFPVPGGFLLSPLHGNLLQLPNKVALMLKKWEAHLDMENVPRAFEGRSESSLPPGPVRGHVAKQMKPSGKKMMCVDRKTRKDRDDTSVIVNKEVNIGMPTSQEILSNMPAPTTEIKSETQFAQETTRNTCISRPSQRNDDVRLKEQIGGNDLPTVKTEVIKSATKYTENSSFENSRTGILAPKGEPKIKMGKVDIGLEERDMSHHKSSFEKKKSKVKAERKFEAAMVDCEYNENRNKEWNAGPCDDLRNIPVKETFSSNRTGDDNTRNEVKRMHKEHHVSAAASYELMEDDNCTHRSAADMDRENATELKSCHFEKKAKYHKDIDETLPNRCQGDMEEGLLEERSAQGELQKKVKIMNTNNENEFNVGSVRKETPISVKHGQLRMPSNSGVATMNADSVHAPVEIKEHWVCCDICQKWRLLPYGTNPTMLPKKWKCSMLYWLPGMNRCDISEDETTNALNALYAIPAPATAVSSGGPQTAGSSAYNISGQFEQSRKRKNAPSDGNGLAESSYHTPLSTPLMRNQQEPIRNRRTTDDMHYSFERDSVSKDGPRPVSKSADLVSEKQKSKHKNHSSYSDGGGIMERNKENSKIKNKRGIDQDEQQYKKNIEDTYQIGRDQDNDCDSNDADVPDKPKALLAKAKTMKVSHETGDISLCKENATSGQHLLENLKSINAMDLPFHSEKKERPSDEDILDLSCKKNVVKKWEENQLNSIHVSNRSKREKLKEKKSNTLKSEVMASKADSRPGKVQHAETMLSSSGGRLKYELVADNKFVTGKESLSEQRETSPPKQALDLAEPIGRDVAYLQSSTVATSSSSKISSSRRYTNSQEAKDSPVKSVSSSPLRNFNIEKLPHDRKDGTVAGSLGDTHNSVRYQNSEVSASYNGQKAGNFEGDWATGLPNLTANDTGLGRRDSQPYSGDKKGLDMEGPSPQPDQHLFDRRATILDTESGPITHESKNIEICQRSGTVQRSGMSFKKEKSHLRIDNQDIRNPVAQVVNLPIKEGKQKVCPNSVKFDLLKMKPQLMRSNVKNGVQHGTVKQTVSNPSDTSPMANDGSIVAFALKEARDLKHKANALKNKGQELESTGLYFEAALKFLHVAFLLETPSFDSSRPGDVAQSMKMYSETAILCNFCAYEYERCKKMAAAALAYKCVEVAYLKAAYYKHPSASKDRQELQAAVQMAPGESPSSSASDIDNLHSHGLSKASTSKGGNSSQVPGNHLPIAVHNQSHLLRLLAYTNDVNLAFDATRKSELVIASAAGSKERGEGVDDGLASVKTVLNLNFSNVNELLKLVRVSMESLRS